MKRFLRTSIPPVFLPGFLFGLALLLFLAMPLYAADQYPANCPKAQGDMTKCPNCPVNELKQEI